MDPLSVVLVPSAHRQSVHVSLLAVAAKVLHAAAVSQPAVAVASPFVVVQYPVAVNQSVVVASQSAAVASQSVAVANLSPVAALQHALVVQDRVAAVSQYAAVLSLSPALAHQSVPVISLSVVVARQFPVPAVLQLVVVAAPLLAVVANHHAVTKSCLLSVVNHFTVLVLDLSALHAASLYFIKIVMIVPFFVPAAYTGERILDSLVQTQLAVKRQPLCLSYKLVFSNY